jgi:hypothetical protein
LETLPVARPIARLSSPGARRLPRSYPAGRARQSRGQLTRCKGGQMARYGQETSRTPFRHARNGCSFIRGLPVEP